MKRCPQCEFIYEDDQSLCDMDGVLLVFDSRTLPNIHALATVSAPVPGKTQRRSRMVPAFATVILMLVIASVYYVTTQRSAANNNFAPASVSSAAPEAPAPATEIPAPTPESNQVQPPASEPADAGKREPQPATEPRSSTSPAARKATAQPAAAKPEPKKEDSKVGSILKKTGRILKKPFKF